MAEAVGGFSDTKLVVNPETVAITVRSQNGQSTYFKIRRDSKLRKLLQSFCDKGFLDYPSTKFFIDGCRFNHYKSPNDLELEDNTEIEAMVEQTGAGNLSSP